MTTERLKTIAYNMMNLLSDIYEDIELVEELGIDFGELEELKK